VVDVHPQLQPTSGIRYSSNVDPSQDVAEPPQDWLQGECSVQLRRTFGPQLTLFAGIWPSDAGTALRAPVPRATITNWTFGMFRTSVRQGRDCEEGNT
jgi:hypothetical protein